MPATIVKKLAKEKGISLAEAEKRWEKAKEITKEQTDLTEEKDGDDYWAYVVGVFKKSMGVKNLVEWARSVVFESSLGQKLETATNWEDFSSVFKTAAGLNAPNAILESSDIDKASDKAALSPNNKLPEPSEKQKHSGNYKKGVIRIAGLDISIENPNGSERKGTGLNGVQWKTVMNGHYGYFKKTLGKDLDPVDVFIKPDLESEEVAKLPVFVVDQTNSDGSFDEVKCMMGYASKKEAKAAYLSNYAKGWTGLGAITELPLSAFKSWVMDKKATKKGLVLESSSFWEDTESQIQEATSFEEIKAAIERLQ